jgi:hypothetical protein
LTPLTKASAVVIVLPVTTNGTARGRDIQTNSSRLSRVPGRTTPRAD